MQGVNNDKICPCCSGKPYLLCCKPIHDGSLPINALQLMRSRYSAYAFGLLDYIVETMHPSNPSYLKDPQLFKQHISRFAQDSIFHRLEIIDFHDGDSVATVIFKAYISCGRQDVSFKEKSLFERVKGRWLYKDGTILI